MQPPSESDQHCGRTQKAQRAYSSLVLSGLVICFATKSPSKPPSSWAIMNNKTEAGAIPTMDEVKTLPTVIAGFANEVLEVNKIAPNIQSGTYIAIKSSRFGNLRIIQSKTIVAKFQIRIDLNHPVISQTGLKPVD